MTDTENDTYKGFMVCDNTSLSESAFPLLAYSINKNGSNPKHNIFSYKALLDRIVAKTKGRHYVESFTIGDNIFVIESWRDANSMIIINYLEEEARLQKMLPWGTINKMDIKEE